MSLQVVTSFQTYIMIRAARYRAVIAHVLLDAAADKRTACFHPDQNSATLQGQKLDTHASELWAGSSERENVWMLSSRTLFTSSLEGISLSLLLGLEGSIFLILVLLLLLGSLDPALAYCRACTVTYSPSRA